MKATLIAITWVVSLCGAFYFGSRIGARENWLADAQYRAAIAASRLHLMDQNRLSDLRDALEMALDGEIVTYGDYLDSRWKWLWPGLQPETPRAIEFAAKYRASHPYAEPNFQNSEDFPKVDPVFRQELATEQASFHATMERVVQMYAGK